MLKRVAIAAIAAATFSVAAPNASADLSVTAIVSKHNISATEAAAAVLIADALGLDATFVINTGRRTGESLVVLGPAFVISQHTRKPVLTIWDMRRKGKGWGVIAKECGMHPGTFNKLRVQGDFERAIWLDLAYRRYGYAPSVIVELEKRGMGPKDWVTAVALSEGRKDRLIVLADDWKKDKSWKSVVGKGHGGPPGKGPDPSKGHGKGNAGKGKGRGG